MNKILLLLFTFSIFSLQAQEQTFRTEDVLVSRTDLESDIYSKDSTANAFYIYEEGYSRFREGNELRLVTDYTAKLKILNKEGYDHANVEIRLQKNDRSEEEIDHLKAITYYLEDGIQKSEQLDASKVYTEEHPSYDLVKFTFPGLRPGAVIVYSYELSSPFFFKFNTWWFQEDIPKLYSKFVSEIPGNFNYNIKKVGYQKLDSQEEEIVKRCFYKSAPEPGSCLKTEYVMKNIPAFVEEKYLTSRYNYISRLEYELIQITTLDGRVKKYTKTWDDVDRELRKDGDLGKQLRKSSVAKNLLPDSIQKQPNDLHKAKAIYAFVKDNYTWNGDYKIFDDMKIKDLVKERTGNVSAINTLLHNIYDEQGYKVLPVLMATRSSGVPSRLYPILSEFNYLIVQLQIGEEKYLLDATEKYLDFGNLPYRCLNHYARLLDFDEGSSWIDIDPEEFSTVTFHDSLKVNADGTSTGISRQILRGYHAIAAREKLEELSNNEIFSSLTNAATHTRAQNVTYTIDPESEENLNLSFELNNESQKINDLIYVNPFSFQFFDENPFQLSERQYPIDFGYKDAYSYSITLQIPEGHEVVELPEQKWMKLPQNAGMLQFMVQQMDENNISVYCRVNFPKTTYEPGYYPYLKEFFNTLIDIQKQSIIVLQQKS
ncbi:hypothetical protein [Salinimicrobium sp. GXAS 041]|uniref:hypothetical protein n=1 Tax=Salinimicrobium sp. GXAS 041 TaxID=3400806 RepID=UPI003C794648